MCENIIERTSIDKIKGGKMIIRLYSMSFIFGYSSGLQKSQGAVQSCLTAFRRSVVDLNHYS